MLPLIGSLVSGGASLLGSYFGAEQSGKNTQMQIQASKEQQATQNAFSEQMSSTAYQRAAKDMESAGLNKSMMFGSGGAASSPQGSGIQAPTPQTRSAGEGIGHAVNQAVSSAVSFKTMDKMTDEMANLRVENKRLEESVKLVHASTATEKAREVETRHRANSEQERTQAMRRDVPRQEWDAIKHIDLSRINDDIRRAAHWSSWGGGKIADTIAPLASSAGAVKRLFPTRSTSQRSHVDSKGNSFDEFWENRTGSTWR